MANLKTDVIDFESLDDYFKSDYLQESEKLAEEKIDKKPKTKAVKKDEKYSISETASLALSIAAKKKLEYYIKKSPQFKDVENQIEILELELANYLSIGRKDLAEKVKITISDLRDTKKKFIKFFKEVNYKKEKENSDAAVKNSPLINTLKQNIKVLKKEYELYNTNSIYSNLMEYRKMLSTHLNDTDIFADNDEPIDFDDLDEEFSDTNLTTAKKYEQLLLHISELTATPTSQLIDMPSSKIRNLLIEFEQPEKIAEIKSELEEAKYQLSSEISKAKGYEDITDIVVKIFDFETEEVAPKEMLAAATIPYVKSIAFKFCSSINMLHNYDDAVAYGLLGLSQALDKWYNIQKMKNSAVSFSGFSGIYISNNIKRGLWELTSGGMMSKSSLATFAHKKQKYMKDFMSNNPEFKDLPEELVSNLIEGIMGDAPGTVYTEGEYSSTVGGEESNNSDIWANAAREEGNISEEKLDYEDLLNSIKLLFTLFEVKVDKSTGINKITNKKLFDKFDYKLFKIIFGFEFKMDEENSKYTQAEIATILSDYTRAQGIPLDKDYSQPAINYRIEQLYKKLKHAVDHYPEIKTGFDYLWTYAQANNTTANLLSNANEELGIKMDKEIMAEMYNDDAVEMEKKLASGKTLNDFYQKSSNNPLDEELANSFRNIM